MRAAPLALLCCLWPCQAGDPIAVATVDDSFAARSVELLAGPEPVLRFADSAGASRDVKATDLVDVTLAAPSPPRVAAEGEVSITLANGDVVVGALAKGAPDQVALVSEGLGELRLRFDEIDSIRFLSARSRWPRARPGTTEGDVVVKATGDEGRGTLKFAGKAGLVYRSRTLERDVSVSPADCAAVFLNRPTAALAPDSGLQAVVELRDASVLRGSLGALSGQVLKLGDRELDLRRVAGFHFVRGRVVHLSDLPAEASDDPVFPWRPDRNVLDGPLSVGGRAFRRGVGMRGGTTLTFRLGKQHKTFAAWVGVDDAARSVDDARPVTFQVLVDGKVRFDSGALTAKGARARIVTVDVAGAESLVLKAEGGVSAGAYADWGLPRLIR